MTVTASDASALIRQNRDATIESLPYRATDLLTFLREYGRVVPWSGGDPLQWNLLTAGSGRAELYVENQALPESSKRTFATAQMSPWYARCPAAVTGRVMDIVAAQGAYEDIMRGEMNDAITEMLYLIDQTLAGSAQDKGIASLVDSADVAYGLDPASVTLHASLETGSIGTLEASDMATQWHGLVNREAQTSVILAPVNQITNYTNIGGIGDASSRIVRRDLDSSSPYDIRPANGVAYQGIPIRQCRSLATTEMYWLDMESSTFELRVMRDVVAKVLGARNDNTEAFVSMGLALYIKNRRRQGKFTGITA